jgi:hypothetical protein
MNTKTESIKKHLNENVMRYTGNSWITTDGIVITEGVYTKAGELLITCDCGCGSHIWSNYATAADKIRNIREGDK